MMVQDGFWFQIGRNLADTMMAFFVIIGLMVIVFVCALIEVYIYDPWKRRRRERRRNER